MDKTEFDVLEALVDSLAKQGEISEIGERILGHVFVQPMKENRNVCPDDALPAVAREGYLDIVLALLEQGADVNAGGKHPAIMWAACFGREKIFELLLARGANSNALDYMQHTPLQRALNTEHEEYVDLLTPASASTDDSPPTSPNP